MTVLVRDVILRDGSALRLRSPAPEDEADLKAFFDGLDPENRYLRFHGAGRTDLAARDYAHADGESRVALLARFGPDVVAVAGYDRLRDPEVAEVAFAVAEAWQGRGLATRMLEQLAEHAAARGMTRFEANVMSGNRRMLGVFASAGFGVVRHSEWGEVLVTLDIRPTEQLAERIAERDRRGNVASLQPLLAPRSLAVLGASAREDSVGGMLMRSVVRGGFRGVAAPVNRGGGVVASARAAPSLSDLEESPELVIVAVPAEDVLDAATEAAEAGARALAVVSAGFSDTDAPEGRRREEGLLEAVRSRGMRLLGPNSLGLINTDPEVRLEAVLGEVPLRPGGLALSSQSGALGLALLGHAAARRLGIAAFVSVGNRADVSTNDLLEYWGDEERVAVIALYVESFGNPRRFSEIARRVSRAKPVLAVKGDRARVVGDAASHTAAALGDEAAVDALFHQAGVLRVDGTEALFDAAELLERQPLPAGRSVGVVTNSGGLGRLAADACLTRRLVVSPPAPATAQRLAARLPRADRVGNPIDLGRSASAADYAEALDALLEDRTVDAVLILHAGGGGVSAGGALRTLEATAAGAAKPVVACVMDADGALPPRDSWSVPNFRFPEAAVRALGLAADRRDWLSRRLGQAPPLPDVDVEAARARIASRLDAGGPGWLSSADTGALLAAYGVPVVSSTHCGDVDAAMSAASALDTPVALKADFPPPAHAGDVDAVLLGLEGGDAVRAGWRELERRVRAAGREWGGAIVQPLEDPGADLLVGAVADATLGPVIGLGMGGRQAGLTGDAAFRLVPLTDVDVSDLVESSRGVRAAVAGFRGAPPGDRAALEDLISRFARLVADLPEVAEADLNPVRLKASGATVLDARMRAEPRGVERRAKTW